MHIVKLCEYYALNDLNPPSSNIKFTLKILIIFINSTLYNSAYFYKNWAKIVNWENYNKSSMIRGSIFRWNLETKFGDIL